MVRLNNFKFLAFSTLLCLIACNQSSSRDFDNFIEYQYTSCNDSNICTVDLHNLPFKWDKFYIFSENHFPEISKGEDISAILGAEYDKSIDINDRLIVFLYNGKVVKDVNSRYEKENFIDRKPLLVDFYLDKKTPLYFTSDNAKFIIEKYNGYYTLRWISNK